MAILTKLIFSFLELEDIINKVEIWPEVGAFNYAKWAL